MVQEARVCVHALVHLMLMPYSTPKKRELGRCSNLSYLLVALSWRGEVHAPGPHFPSPSSKNRCKRARRTESTPWRNSPLLTSQHRASFPSLPRPRTKMPGPGHSVLTDKSLLPVRSISQNYLGDGRHWTTGVDLDLKYDIFSVGQHMLPLNFTCKSRMLKAVLWAKQAFAI